MLSTYSPELDLWFALTALILYFCFRIRAYHWR